MRKENFNAPYVSGVTTKIVIRTIKMWRQSVKIKNIFSVWSGVYQSFSDCGASSDAFDSERWIGKQQIKCRAALDGLENTENEQFVSKNYPLALVTALALGSKPSLSIMDFGGGMGLQYLELLVKVPDASKSVTYFVVEGQKLIEALPIKMMEYPRLFFSSDLQGIDMPIDMIHIGSTLQYIDDWQGLLSLLIETYNPKHFVFSDLLAGDIPSFVTTQIFYEQRIPMWFFSATEVLGFLKSKGYSCLYREKYVHKILDQDEIFPNFDLPLKYQIDRSMNLVFERI